MKTRLLPAAVLAMLLFVACTNKRLEVKDLFVSTDSVAVLAYRPARIYEDDLVQAFYKDMKLNSNIIDYLTSEAEAREMDPADRSQIAYFIFADGSLAVLETSTSSPSLETMREYLGKKTHWSNFTTNDDGSMSASLPDEHGRVAPPDSERNALLEVEKGRVIYGNKAAVEELQTSNAVNEFKSAVLDMVDFDADFYVLVSNPDGIPYTSGGGNMRASRSDKVHDIQAIGLSLNLGEPVEVELNVQCASEEAAADLKEYLESLDGDLVEIAKAFVHPMMANIALFDKRELLRELEHTFELTRNEDRVSVSISADRDALAREVTGYGAALTQRLYRETSSSKVESLGLGVEMYMKKHTGEGAPDVASIEDLGELLKQNNEYLPFDFGRDAWGNPLVYERLNDGGYRIICLGADGRRGESGGKWDADIIWENGRFITPVEEPVF